MENHTVRALAQILGVATIAAALAGCQQPVATEARGTPDIAVATADPVMLSGAAFASDGAAATDNMATGSVATQGGPLPSAGSGAMPMPQNPPPQTAGATPPAPAQIQPVTTSAASPLPQAEPPQQTEQGPAFRADGYPNINVAPQEPGGKLLTPEERAKLIAELNALAGRNSSAQ